MNPLSEACVAMMVSPGGWHVYPCSNPGKVHREGAWYCGVHDPIAIERRAKKRGPTKFERECAAAKKRRELQAELLLALKDVCSQYPLVHPGPEPAWIRNARLAIAQLTETQMEEPEDEPTT